MDKSGTRQSPPEGPTQGATRREWQVIPKGRKTVLAPLPGSLPLEWTGPRLRHAQLDWRWPVLQSHALPCAPQASLGCTVSMRQGER